MSNLYQSLSLAFGVLPDLVDEIGPMELNNQGWAESIRALCQSLPTTQLWVVRESLVIQVVRKWSVGDTRIFHLEQDQKEAIGERINAHLFPVC